MLVAKTFGSIRALLDLYRGAEIARGATGTNTAGDGTFSDATGTPFSGVLAGDVLVISGEATTSFAVSTVTDDNNIEVTPVIPTLHNGSAYATWRIFRGAIDPSDVVVGPVYEGNNNGGGGFLIYDEPNFDN